MNNFEKILEEFKAINLKLDEINGQLRYENKIMRAELAERLKLNLQGQEAIKHYNRWMKTAGLDHLIIDNY